MKYCDASTGTAGASVCVDAEARETCSVLKRVRAGVWLIAEVGETEYPQAGLAGGTQNCVVNHKNWR